MHLTANDHRMRTELDSPPGVEDLRRALLRPSSIGSKDDLPALGISSIRELKADWQVTGVEE